MKHLILVDDDVDLIQDIADEIRFFLLDKGIRLQIALDIDSLEETLNKLPKEDEVIAAIIDLWINARATNVPDHGAGVKALNLIRKRYPESYGIIHSAHLNSEVVKQFKEHKFIAIVVKPVPTRELTNIIEEVIKNLM